jgi:lipopolysaccharide biosynthesis protein
MAHFCKPHRKTFSLSAIEPLHSPPGTIAVHLHIFYIELLDEFKDWISRIPYPFDLFVSVAADNAAQAVCQSFEDCPNISKLNVEAVENRGRDVAPMIVTFPGLSAYDYVLHIHSKKSPHLDGAFDWRGYLLTNLMRDETHIRRIISLFTLHPEIGILYPEPHPKIPYWTLTTLVNEPEMRRLFKLIGIPFPEDEKYIDFPVGTMFWARGNAIGKLLKSQITLEDFPEESGQLDGTLSHAIERSICLIASDAGYAPAQLSAQTDTVNIGPGARNLSEYLATDVLDMVKYLRRFRHSAYDIFGTLICSSYENDDALFRSVEQELGHPFISLRKEAEKNVRSAASAVDIHKIYMEYRRLSGLTDAECEKIKSLEFALFAESCRPRAAVAEVFPQQCLSTTRYGRQTTLCVC